MIKLENVSKTFATDEVETTALSKVSFGVSKGEFVAIMGPSGCGKSTLLNILGTLDRPDSGSYAFGESIISNLNENALADFRARHLGFIFQSFNLIEDLNIFENVELGLLYRDGVADRKALVADALQKVGVDHRSRHFPHQLSGGQQQRVAIARAIVGEPDIILADEPTGNLDSKNGDQVMGLLKALHAKGATMVMVTHSEDQARSASRIVRMRDGRIL